MRVQIREQLSVFTLLSTLFALAVVAVATWITAHSFTLDIRSSRLSLTASLKASQLASNLALMESTVAAMTTRLRVQAGLDRYINGTTTADNWAMATEDLTNVLATSQRAVLTFQTLVYPRPNVTTTHLDPVMNVSNPSIPDNLNFQELYPNISYVRGSGGHNGIVPKIRDTVLNTNTAILQGPVQYNASLFLVSITLPIISNTTATDIIGWLTAVIDARLIFEVVTSAVGLDTTGIVLLVGPVENYNRFPGSLVSRTPPFINDTDILSQIPLHFLLPPQQDNATGIRHPLWNVTFTAPQFPSVLSALTQQHPVLNNASSNINTKNEAGQTIAVGYALPPTNLCDWVLLLEEERSEVLEPISHLRNILLACVFITAAVMALTTWILAHFFVRPIRRLREATEATVEPLGYDSSDDAMPRSSSSASISEKRPGLGGVRHSSHSSRKSHRHRTTAEFWSFLGFHNRRQTTGPRAVGERARVRVPSKVKTPKRYWIRDELTELTETFNEMSDELYLQYAKLEERVKARTSELELSKKAAEAANESKTLFIANISHELKSPLNAILGMAAICMQERDLQKIQQSLSIIYKSGDLLHNLLTDLLTFSKNQVGHHLTLDEKEFSVKDIAVQLNAIFDAQAKESNITLDVVFEGVCDAVGNMETTTDKIYGPAGSGRVKDMYVWGDQQRILQVAINLLSNSLKFTPEGGSVVMRIRCSGEYERSARPSNASIGSRSLASREKTDSILVLEGAADTKIDTATQINAISPRRRSSLAPSSIASMSHSELLAPPPNAKTFVFEFEVEDTGPGIPEHLQEQIFEPFVQGDLRLTKKFGGTGLGLSIVSQLAKLMNGIIRVESEVGAGSRFTLRIPLKYVQSRRDSFATSYNEMMGTDNIAVVDDHDANDEAQTGVPDSHESQSRAAVRRRTPSLTFDADRKPRLVGLSQPYFSNATPPLTSPAADPMASAAESSKKRNRVRVLVAEDNKVNQEVVLRMLRLEDIFDVHLAKDGQEAFEKVRESMEAGEPYQLIFMDVQMPNLDGRESTRQIRELGYEAPIVALTAFADEINQKACMECGMDYFLAKPIRRPALRHVLRTYCPTITEEDERSNEASSISGRSRASASEDGRAGKMKRLASGLTMSEERTNRLEVIYSSDTGRDPAAQANGEFERTPSSKETA